MQYLLTGLAVLVGLLGLVTSALARTSVHEIYGAVMLLIGAVLLCGGAVVAAVERLRADVRAARLPPA